MHIILAVVVLQRPRLRTVLESAQHQGAKKFHSSLDLERRVLQKVPSVLVEGLLRHPYSSPGFFSAIRSVVNDTAQVGVLLYNSHSFDAHLTDHSQMPIGERAKESDLALPRPFALKNQKHFGFAWLEIG